LAKKGDQLMKYGAYSEKGSYHKRNQDSFIIKKVKIVIPPAELIKEFDKQKEPLYQTIRALMIQNDKLIKQRDTLLPRLMSGKLKV